LASSSRGGNTSGSFISCVIDYRLGLLIISMRLTTPKYFRIIPDVARAEKSAETAPPSLDHARENPLLQLAMDHAFTGSYVVRFRPNDPEEASACPCGAIFKTDSHVFYDCSHNLIPVARHLSRMVYNGTKTPYHAIYRSRNVHRLLIFLQKSGALSRPDPGPPDVPPDPD
jgi:hypothetical protein